MIETPPSASVERVFLGWGSPALPEAARLLADRYGKGEELDLRRVVAVTPASRAGRRMGELLLEEADGRGVSLTPPRFVTLGQFPELLYRPRRPLVDEKTARHVFVRALQETEAHLLEIVFPVLPAKIAGWLALAGLVEGLHRVAGAEGLDFREVAGRIRRGFPYDDSLRWEALAGIQARYRDLLNRAGLADPDGERRVALEEGRIAAPGDVWLAGVAEMPGLVRRMIERLPNTLGVLVHAPETVRERFDALGCVVPERWEDVHLPLEAEKIRVVDRPPDQARAVAEILRDLGGRFAPEEVVVSVPDAELVPYVERGLSMAGVPHRYAGGTRLEDSGPVRLLEVVAEYLDGRSVPAFASLIRHPDLHDVVEAAGQQGEITGALTNADQFQSAHLQVSVEGPLPGEGRYARRIRTLVTHLEVSAGLGTLSGIRRLSRWMPEILEVLVRVYGGRPLDRGNRRDRHLLESLRQIKDAAARLATLAPPLDPEVEAREALVALLEDLRGGSVPPDPDEHAVELLGWLELPMDDAPAVVLTGLNDRRIPEALGGDPFLPGALRSYLGLPDDAARYARDAYLLSALAASRTDLHLVVGRLSADGDPLRPSRLLFAAPDREVARRVRWFLEDGGGPEGASLSGAERVKDAGDAGRRRRSEASAASGGAHRGAGPSARSRFHSPPEDPLTLPEIPDRIRVTDFRALLSDPFRYALTRALKLEPLDDQAREMDGGSFGTLAHKVLERFGRSEATTSTEVRVVEAELDRLLLGAARETFGRRPLPAVQVQVHQLGARLRAFARWQARWVSEGWRIVGVEKQALPGVPFVVDGVPILLRGKIDRIDHNPRTGEWAVFDYKTGDGGEEPEAVHRRGRGKEKAWVDLQLPLYRVLLPGILAEDGTPVVPESARRDLRLGYLLLPKSLDKVGAAMADWSEAQLEEAEEVARGAVRILREGTFRYDPGTGSFPGDPFDALLGRMELPLGAEEEEGGE
jgi:hypothetical protein